MAYSGVFTFGDSLVDSGNALKLAETYDYFPFTSLPNGAPTSGKGYHSGNFTNGWTFADLLSNKYLGVTTKTVFPFGYDDPYFGISVGFISDPSGNNLNFAYGGGQIRQGEEAVPDMDDQTDAYRDAVDGDADPNALHLFVFGANDLHDLVPKSGAWVSEATAMAALQKAANEYIEEVRQTIEIGAQHILLVGIPDIGIQPFYNGTESEAARRAVATEYAEILDGMIQAQLGELAEPGVTIHYIPFADLAGSVLGTMVDLYGESQIYPLNLSNEVFFDLVHPTTQVHALAAAYMIDLLSGVPAGEAMPLTAPDYSMSGLIGAKGEVDLVTVSLAANTSYTFQLLGLSSLGGDVSVLADPTLVVLGPTGTLVGSNDDGGVGLDSSFTFTSGAAGDYTIKLTAVGMMTGSYLFQADGQAGGNNSYLVSHAGAVILEQAGGGFDTVKASISYALNAGAEVEVLRTANDRGRDAINLTGNEYGQTLVGNAGSNILEGKGGADVLTGGAGKDVFVLSGAPITNPGSANVDRITDYGSGDVVDISQVLSVAAGTNVVSGGYVRVTTGGLVQVDVDGGGNNWVSLSQINGIGAVTVKYVSGGIPTSISVARVPTGSTAVVAGSVAAAGLAATAIATSSTADAAGAQAAGDLSLSSTGAADANHLALSWPSQSVVASEAGGAAQEGAVLQQGLASHDWRQSALDEGVALQDMRALEPATELPAGTSRASHDSDPAIVLGALTVAMPPAEMLRADADGSGPAVADAELAAILVDALQEHEGGQLISDVLREMATQGAAGHDGNWRSAAFAANAADAMAALDTIPGAPPIEIISFHPDYSVPV